MSIGAAGTSRPLNPAQRVRVPPPLIRTRLPSGRGATEQPNATGDGDAALTPVFWVMVVLTGVAAGLLGDLMMLLLFSVQRLAFGYQGGSLQVAVEQASDARRIVVLLVAGGSPGTCCAGSPPASGPRSTTWRGATASGSRSAGRWAPR